ncbi:MAG: leucine--tRNA ligase, partial [Marinilabiliales bacterium]
LQEVDAYLPTEKGEPPLGRAKSWHTEEGYPYELSTMPGFAGSSAYYLRYMDPKNNEALVSKEANQYWKDVDLYIGGTEHATGHLIYSRFWNKFLFDIGWVCKDEPFRKLINQGMIQGRSNFVYRVKGTNKFVSLSLIKEYDVTPIHVDVNIVHNDILDVDAFKNWNPEYKDAEFIFEDGNYICGYAVEKMSKSLYNVVNPDDVIEQYGADTLRMYEMFLGPLEMSKPWDTNGIDGVHKFLRKFWRLFHDDQNKINLSEEKANADELKVLHKTIKKIQEDIERFSFNTSVSAFMICVNELNELKCNKREILEPLTILLSSFAPHITEEIWSLCGKTNSITYVNFPKYEDKYLVESSFDYPVSFNGKMRFKIQLPMDIDAKSAEQKVLENESAQKWLEGKTPRKVIFVPKKIINIVI